MEQPLDPRRVAFELALAARMTRHLARRLVPPAWRGRRLSPLTERALGAFVPFIAVWVGVALLCAAALAVLWDAVPGDELTLFGAGAGSWLAGIGWGVWFNGRPGAHVA